jgi:hypothetical protein
MNTAKLLLLTFLISLSVGAQTSKFDMYSNSHVSILQKQTIDFSDPKGPYKFKINTFDGHEITFASVRIEKDNRSSKEAYFTIHASIFSDKNKKKGPSGIISNSSVPIKYSIRFEWDSDEQYLEYLNSPNLCKDLNGGSICQPIGRFTTSESTEEVSYGSVGVGAKYEINFIDVLNLEMNTLTGEVEKLTLGHIKFIENHPPNIPHGGTTMSNLERIKIDQPIGPTTGIRPSAPSTLVPAVR